MKLATRLFTTFCFALALGTITGCTSSPTQEGTGEYFDDSMVTAKVKHAILHEPSLKSSEINVETFKGTVQLSGFIRSQANIDKAVELASAVKGAKSVKNDMRVK